MSFDFQKILASKAAHRRKLAKLPIAEKLRLLDAMRERAVAICGGKVAVAPPMSVREESATFQAKPKTDGDERL